MNKIIVNGDKISLDINSSLDVEVIEKKDVFDITKIKINTLKSTSLVIEYNSIDEAKLDIIIEVKENDYLKLYELRCEDKIKVQYKYYLNRNSNLLVNKFYDCNKVKELDVIYLNGEFANVDYNYNSISKNKQNLDIVVYHNAKNTISNLTNKAVNFKDGSTKFNVTGIVYNGINDCIINQSNRIINLNDKKCTINPILIIDENDVEANHSALIGKFSDKELFYLMSRGITEEKALNLLIKGFLNVDVKNKKKLDQIINKYWR